MIFSDSESTLRERLLHLLPFGLLISLAAINILYWIVRIAPQLSSYEHTQADLRTAQEALTQTEVQLTLDNNADVVQLQLTHAADQTRDAAKDFLTQLQADSLVTKLYDYASTSGVIITLLQNQPAQADTRLPYTIQMFHVQINGGVPQLLNFVARIEEVTRAGFLINEMAVIKTQNGAVLTLNLQLYILSGDVDYPLPVPFMTITPIPTLTPLETSTPFGTPVTLPGTPTSLSTVLPGTMVTPSATITETVVMSKTSLPLVQSSQTPWIIMQTAQPQPTQPPAAAQVVVVTQLRVEQIQIRVVVTATPSFTPTPTLTATASETPTLTATATSTETPTLTTTASETPTLTATATSTETPTPESSP